MDSIDDCDCYQLQSRMDRCLGKATVAAMLIVSGVRRSLVELGWTNTVWMNVACKLSNLLPLLILLLLLLRALFVSFILFISGVFVHVGVWIWIIMICTPCKSNCFLSLILVQHFYKYNDDYTYTYSRVIQVLCIHSISYYVCVLYLSYWLYYSFAMLQHSNVINLQGGASKLFLFLAIGDWMMFLLSVTKCIPAYSAYSQTSWHITPHWHSSFWMVHTEFHGFDISLPATIFNLLYTTWSM